jgi:hypothetical protein
VRHGERSVDVGRCSCGGPVRWENLHDPSGERWLGLCERCNRMMCVPLDDPRVETSDPLTVFFCGNSDVVLPQPRPPWLRFVRMTSGRPWNVHWSMEAGGCSSCPQALTAARRGVVNRRCSGSYEICLGCGWVRVRYTDNHTRSLLADLTGTEWTPPGPPVRRLRADVFALYRFMDDQFQRTC